MTSSILHPPLTAKKYFCPTLIFISSSFLSPLCFIHSGEYVLAERKTRSLQRPFLFFSPSSTHLWHWTISNHHPSLQSSLFHRVPGLITLVLFQGTSLQSCVYLRQLKISAKYSVKALVVTRQFL